MAVVELPSPELHSFNFLNFMDYINTKGIITMAITIVLSSRINDLTHALFDSIIVPIMNKHEKINIKTLENKVIIINGVTLHIGKFIFSMVKFIIVVYIIFIISIILKKFHVGEKK